MRDHDPLSALARQIDFEGPGGCWLWTGTIFYTGYGNSKGRTTIHRAMWKLVVGPIPPKLVLDHLCFVRSCCNPDHLEPVTQRVNLARSRHRRRLVAA